uniref:CRAL-TRIO domain-containing protein n=1 Tax=Pseudo-nitzschia australis TaxID=44445 RepID=A0A7S4EHS8_9STRA|mmetsp:Transcript_9443/g.20060  ORF Transcript_9443/g.20060 Transcript_9443/m.20060 type:complete len:392 (-) Transcript_9443:70-1245(-)
MKMAMDDLELMLTPEEQEWAFALEEAIYRGRPDVNVNQGGGLSLSRTRSTINNSNAIVAATTAPATTQLYGKPSDFEIAAHALRAKGNTSKGLKRLQRMKIFKDAYNIPDFDLDSGSNRNDPIKPILKLMKKFLTGYPQFLQKIGIDKFGRVAVQLQLDGLRWSQPPPFNHTETERFQAFYYLLHATQPTLESIRRGTVWIGDIQNITERPSAALFRGGRMLLRDSYPIKVQDVPVVDCPPRFSKVYATTYPFFSSHFVSKFVRVTPDVLRAHFPPELLSDRLRGINNTKKGRIINRRRARYKTDNSIARKRNVDVSDIDVVSSNGDDYDNKWENLDDDDEKDANGINDRNNGIKNGGVGDQEINESEELLMRIERLLRMRFKTERSFRVI